MLVGPVCWLDLLSITLLKSLAGPFVSDRKLFLNALRLTSASRKGDIEFGSNTLSLLATGERTIIVTRELFPKHPPSGSAFQGQEDYETYLEKYTGLE